MSLGNIRPNSYNSQHVQGQASLSERANAQMASCVASNGQMYANVYPSCVLRNLQWHIILNNNQLLKLDQIS